MEPLENQDCRPTPGTQCTENIQCMIDMKRTTDTKRTIPRKISDEVGLGII